jgi:hypothetical protein
MLEELVRCKWNDRRLHFAEKLPHVLPMPMYHDMKSYSRRADKTPHILDLSSIGT